MANKLDKIAERLISIVLNYLVYQYGLALKICPILFYICFIFSILSYCYKL